METKKAYFHLPGLFEFYELYSLFLPLFYEHRDYFYDWCEIGSIYGAPQDCLWGGGRVENGETNPQNVLRLLNHYGISARLTFSNSLLRQEHLQDYKCNALCRLFSGKENLQTGTIHPSCQKNLQTGIILHSDLLLAYLQKNYPEFYYVSSTTKVLTDFSDFQKELDRPEFSYVVPDFRLNKALAQLEKLTEKQKAKTEFLCNECCNYSCRDRKACYEDVSRKNLGIAGPDHICRSPYAGEGYCFSRAMENPGFISVEDITNCYLPMGFRNYKIEGRGLGSAMVLEFLLYYMTKPGAQLRVREAIYLDSMLDLF